MVLLKTEQYKKTSIYENCYSLGFFCGVACALSKNGLRGCSGPFDWYFSDYKGVLRQIDTGFSDFVQKNNLKLTDDPKVFVDDKYNFRYNHDVKRSFFDEYEEIHNKYKNRAERFMRDIVNPTIFFRCIRDDQEVRYINENWEYARNVVKRFNKDNEIIYVYREGLINLTDKVKSFCLNINVYIGKMYEMRHMFDKSESLLTYCSSIRSDNVIEQNIKFDNEYNAQKAMVVYVNKYVESDSDGIDELIMRALDINSNESFYIWGAGSLGIPLANYLMRRNIKIKGFIDNKAQETNIEGLRVVRFDELSDGEKIFIAVAKKETNDAIVNQINDKHSNDLVARYMDLEEKTGLID